MSKCLVLGGWGFIGSHVVDALLEAGHEVTIIDNGSTGCNRNINAEELPFDITFDSTWSNIDDDYEYVFHLAALARIQPSIDDPIEANDVNLVGTLHALEYCRKSGAKLIFSGSSSIYADIDSAITESSPKTPKSPYAMQKLMCEQYIILYQQLFGIKACRFRYFNVFGERQILSGAYAAVVGIFLDQFSKGEKLTITGNGEQRRDFTYVKDVAKANLLGMKLEGVYNLGTGRNYSMNELAKIITNDDQSRFGYLPKRAGEAWSTLCNNSKAIKAGWRPTRSIEDWITEQL